MRGKSSVFHMMCPRYSGHLTPAGLMACELLETYFFTVSGQCQSLRVASSHSSLLTITDSRCKQRVEISGSACSSSGVRSNVF